MKTIAQLIKKDLLIEWRQRYAISGILIHIFSATFIVYLSVRIVNAPTWNALYWVIMLFTSVSAVAKSFIAEGRGKNLYYHSIATPQEIIISKIIYNSMLSVFLGATSILVYILFMNNPVQNTASYLLIVLLGCIGFSSTFTMLSAIASKSGSSNLLMPVLSFPIIIPLLLVLIKASKKSMDGLEMSLIWPDLGILLLLNLMGVVMAYVLFPFLWKE